MAAIRDTIRKHRLTISFLLIIVLFLSIGIITIRGLFTLGQLTRTIYEHPLVVSNASLTAALNITKMHRSMKDVVLANAPEGVEYALNQVAKSERVVFQQLDIIREKILGKEGQALEKQTRQRFVDWKPIREDVVRLLKSGRKAEAIRITKTRGAEHVLRLETKMLALTSYARDKASNFLEIAETSQSKLETVTVLMTLTGIILSLLIAIFATVRALEAEKVLLERNDKLQKAFDEIKILRGIIPICAHCKQIRDDEGMWKRIEEYIDAHSEASFSHSICPDCMKQHYPEAYATYDQDKKNAR